MINQGGRKVFENIILEEEQEELLINLVEIARNIPKEKRDKFMILHGDHEDILIHPGNREAGKIIYIGDIETLGRERLIYLSYASKDTPLFDITPLGFRYYEHLKQKKGLPIERLQSDIRHYIKDDTFQEQYPVAHQKWLDADKLLWQSDSEKQYTTIGHLCREAIQEFADSLSKKVNVVEAKENKSQDITKIRSILNFLSNRLGATEKPFLDALLNYWGTVHDLIQRQEHGGQKEGKSLRWEDARRVVFQTAIVMYEIDNAIKTLDQ